MSFERESFSREAVDGNWRQLYVYISRDKRVNCKARGLWFTVMALPDNWRFTVEGIISIIPDGETAVRAALSNLMDTGYCVRTVQRDSKNIIRGWHYLFKWKPDVEKPLVENPRVENQGQYIEPIIEQKALPEQAQAYVRVNGQYVGQSDDFFADLEADLGSATPIAQPLIDIQPKPKAHKNIEIPESAYASMYELCYSAGTDAEVRFLNTRQRGRVDKVLGQLRDAEADFNRLSDFETWWKASWMSKARDTGQYMPPRPEQVAEYWLVATKQGQPSNHKPQAHTEPVNAPTLADIEKAFRAKGEQR